MEKLYDVLIIGAGPAGISAAIYAVRKNLKTLVVTKDIGGQAAISGDIENYLGFTVITGPDLAQKFKQHVEEFEALELVEGTEVTSLEKKNDHFVVTASDGKTYEARSVIIASGRQPKLLGIPGETEFLGKGVSTCATCDGPLYRDKDVAVVGGGNSAMDAVYSLIKIAQKIYILNITPELAGDEILKKQIMTASNVEHLGNVQTSKILGDSKVTAVEYLDKTTGETKNLAVDGVFIEIGYSPATAFDKLTQKDNFGQIIVNDELETGIPGLFAAGDVNSLWGEQIVIAAGEGAKAALKAAEYLARIPKTNPHYD